MDTIGMILAEERTRQEKTIKDVERATRIRGKYLQAIEEENFGILPGRAYTIAFIRSYASFLGLDSDPLVKEFEVKDLFSEGGHKSSVQQESSLLVQSERTRPRRRGFFVVFLLIFIIALYLLWIFFQEKVSTFIIRWIA